MIHNESHASLSPGGRGIRSPAAGLALLTILGFITGVLLLMVTNAVEQAGIQGDGWSLRGNGALIVPFCGLPVILIVGWVLLALWLQADRRSCLGGPAAGISALFLAILLSSIASMVLLPLTLLVAFIIALLLARGAGQRRTAGWLMAGALVLPVAVSAGFLVGASGILPK